MLNRLRAFASLIVLLFAAPLAAQAPDPAGLWALHADGRILALLELRRDPAAAGGWTGGWNRPERLTITSSHAAYDISGAAVRRAVVGATMRGGLLALRIQARAPEAEPDTFLFRLIDRDHAEFGWDDPRMPPMALVRAEAGAAVAAGWDSGREYPLTTPRPSSSEMAAIFAADQADRRDWTHADHAAVARADAERRARTKALLDGGQLRSGDDFLHAAFVFQHGGTPDNYLLAHSFAIIAAARGRPDAAWIAAATLDRYLQSIGRNQIYGTQSSMREPFTQEPYDRTLVSDALRGALGVPPLADQERQRAEDEARARAAAPSAASPR